MNLVGCTHVEVSYLLLCYNHEQYIRDALHSVLVQLGPGMELVVSDDCSSDRSFSIIRQMCKNYSGGGELTVRRNEFNMGVVPHINRLVTIARGKLIVVGAGDDVAMPNKVGRIIEAWKESHAVVFGCNPEVINEQGEKIGRFYNNGIPEDFSCKAMMQRRNSGIFIAAFDRSIFDELGPLDENLISEDQTIPFRAAMLGMDTIKVIDEPLVQYRSHSESMTAELKFRVSCNPLTVMKRKIFSHAMLYRGWLNELNKYSSGGGILQEEKRILIRRLGFIEEMDEIVKHNSLVDRVGIFIRALIVRKISIWYAFPVFIFSISPYYFSSLLSWAVQRFSYKGKERGVY